MTARPLPDTSALCDDQRFQTRHIGSDQAQQSRMLERIGVSSLEALMQAVVPAGIRRQSDMALPEPLSESQALDELRELAKGNRLMRNFIGLGYHGTITPGVILRNVLENPAWYTAYTPYQAEISQGRMEALVNFQTMVCDLTGMEMANSSMLDEATAAAEAMTMAMRMSPGTRTRVLVAHDVLPQTLSVLRTRAEPIGLRIECVHATQLAQAAASGDCLAALMQYPGANGQVRDLGATVDALHEQGALAIVAADLLALTLLKPPGEFGADLVVGSTQRFGMPMCAGGPHAAYLACRDAHKRTLPGRIVGVSVDTHGQTAYRLALQTREQHIRREKATSNICTAQVLPAVVASMYAVYHGAQGLRRIASRVSTLTSVLAAGLKAQGHRLLHDSWFDTLQIQLDRPQAVLERALARGMNLRLASADSICVSLDETVTPAEVQGLWEAFATQTPAPNYEAMLKVAERGWPQALQRSSDFLTHPTFNRHHSETQMLRYLRSLSDKDLALDRTMIPLGSCTMKLNATSEMVPVTWPEFAQIHPYAPADQLAGYAQLNAQLSQWLSAITGYAGVSLQPNAGSQGEYAGLLAIRAWHASRGQSQRDICLIPESAHGTNPASAHMVGMRVVAVRCDEQGSVDLHDLQRLCTLHEASLAAIMITYPSTYGVFEPRVKELCAMVHAHGARVYIDGANLNALVGLASPGEFGGDVSHLNLHKTFCIPHGGGGPGVGPVCVAEDLMPYLPQANPLAERSASGVGSVSAAPLGNAAVLPISWMYIRMMGAQGLRRATEVAILHANYIAARLSDHYDIHFSGGHPGLRGGGVAHECILDLRPLKDASGVSAEDVAKRLIDYGFHAPTLSFPVAGTLMVEPTESESLEELDRFCDAMIAIRHEIRRIEQGDWPKEDNPLKHAPHTADSLLIETWPHAYSREEAAYPLRSLRLHKYWVPVGRVDNVYGDRNLFCACPPWRDAPDA